MEPILVYLRRRLKEEGAQKWPEIAASASAKMPPRDAGDPKAVTVHSLRKIAYGDRDNPGLQEVQALLDYFGPPPKVAPSVKDVA